MNATTSFCTRCKWIYTTTTIRHYLGQKWTDMSMEGLSEAWFLVSYRDINVHVTIQKRYVFCSISTNTKLHRKLYSTQFHVLSSDFNSNDGSARILWNVLPCAVFTALQMVCRKAVYETKMLLLYRIRSTHPLWAFSDYFQFRTEPLNHSSLVSIRINVKSDQRFQP